MSEKASSFAMRGGDYYSENENTAKLVVDAADGLVIDAITSMEDHLLLQQNTHAFAVADYGAADGGASYALMKRIIKTIRTCASPNRSITITYTDLPHNDFSALFNRVINFEEPNVYTFASGTTFHRQIFPDNTIHLGFSATAMHWLSKIPCLIDDHLYYFGGTDEEKNLFRRQACLDWQENLLARARELVVGGKLVLLLVCGANGEEVATTKRRRGDDGFTTFTDKLAQHWKDFFNTGVITKEEYRATTFQQYFPSIEDLKKPFVDLNSSVSKAGLVLDKYSIHVTKCAHLANYRIHGNVRTLAQAHVRSIRSWGESTFLNALDASNRGEGERQAIVNRFFQAYEDDVALALEPLNLAIDYVHCFMTITKKQ